MVGVDLGSVWDHRHDILVSPNDDETTSFQKHETLDKSADPGGWFGGSTLVVSRSTFIDWRIIKSSSIRFEIEGVVR